MVQSEERIAHLPKKRNLELIHVAGLPLSRHDFSDLRAKEDMTGLLDALPVVSIRLQRGLGVFFARIDHSNCLRW